MLLHVSGYAELVEGALGHPGEDLDHGVDAVLLVAVDEGYHVEAEHEESSVEEAIHEEHLPWNDTQKLMGGQHCGRTWRRRLQRKDNYFLIFKNVGLPR